LAGELHLGSKPFLTIAKRQASASGATNIDEVLAELESKGMSVDLARPLVEMEPELHFLIDDWFWYDNSIANRNRIRNVTRKMLSVTSPISVESLREGIRRNFKYRQYRGLGTWPLVVPPRNVLQAIYQAHPEFTINDANEVDSVAPLDIRNELPGAEGIMVEILRSSPTSVMDRRTLWRRCTERGINSATFESYLSFAPSIERIHTEIYSPRGIKLESAAVEALRREKSLPRREKRVLDSGWTPKGGLWVGTRIPETWSSLVLGIPSEFRRYLADRTFDAVDLRGHPYGRVSVNDAGSSWGYNSFLRRRGADEGDVLIAEFDLVNGTATLRLGGYDLLESFSPRL
jgi:hypothetical protein